MPIVKLKYLVANRNLVTGNFAPCHMPNVSVYASHYVT
jgi:hypothetical protein